jgi:flavin reductase (DIM6/NTAB) family NADH-FMN oxidoreductase RutF
MQIDFSQLSSNEIYHTMTQTLVPRPIAWVLTDNGNGSHNLAPFSYFNAVCSDPPLLMFSVGLKPDGSDKDTLTNIREREKFVIHIPSVDQAETVTETARTLAHGESELALTQLTTTPFEGFSLPRIQQCKIAMACTLYEIKSLGATPQRLIFGKIEQLYLADEITTLDQKSRLKVETSLLDPLARLGGGEYASLGSVFSLTRPA